MLAPFSPNVDSLATENEFCWFANRVEFGDDVPPPDALCLLGFRAPVAEFWLDPPVI